MHASRPASVAGAPPYPSGAAGPNHYVQVVNSGKKRPRLVAKVDVEGSMAAA